MAKRDLKAGERLDGVGGFCAYGLIDNASSARGIDALPIGLSEGCVLRRDVPKDAVVSFGDVISPPGRWPRRCGANKTSDGVRRPAGCRLRRRHSCSPRPRSKGSGNPRCHRPRNIRPLRHRIAQVGRSCLIRPSGGGRKVFLTGHTGFKGSWLSLWLDMLGAEVTGYALAPPTEPNLFEQANVAASMRSIRGDIRDFGKLKSELAECRPDVVIHMPHSRLCAAATTIRSRPIPPT